MMVTKKANRSSPIAQLIVGNAGNAPDILYKTGFSAPDDVVYLQIKGESFLIVWPLEFRRARRAAAPYGITVVTPQHIVGDRVGTDGLARTVVVLLRTRGVSRVTVPSSFPLGFAKRLEKEGILLQVPQGALFPERARKSPEELGRIRECQQVAVIAMRRVFSLIKRSDIDSAGGLLLEGCPLTSELLRKEVARILVEHECVCPNVIVSGGRSSADPHEKGTGRLYAGKPIIVDIFPQHTEHGYWGDLTRTVVRGRASPPIRRMYRAVVAAHNAALAMLRAGVSAKRVHRVAVNELAKRGFRREVREDGSLVGVIHGTGHGVGLAVHEYPAIAANDHRLEAGHVVTIEPGLYYPEIGGVRVEDLVAVTEKGWKYLAPCERPFEM